MNKKRKYLCLLSKIITEKIITNEDDRVSNKIAVKIIGEDMTIRITFLESKTHDNFSILLYEFQSFKSLIKGRKEVFRWLSDTEKHY